MSKRLILLLLACLGLSAQEDPFDIDLPAPNLIARVAIGGYDQAFSDGYGRWKGWTIEGTLYTARGGPWQLAAVGVHRPEGQGTLFAVGRYFLIGEASSIYLGASAGTNTGILPGGRVDVDARLEVSPSWKLDLAGALSRFDGNQEVQLLQAGPEYQGRSWGTSIWYQQLHYEPYGIQDQGCIMNLRFGGNDLEMWHALRLAWGRGIIESTASGGSLPSMGTAMSSGGGGYGGRFGYGGFSSSMMGTPSGTSTTLSDRRPQERLASLVGHWPLTGRIALKAEATWGEMVSTYRFWGGSLQMVLAF